MFSWRKQIAKLVIWLLAGVIPVQPMLAIDCACPCRPSEENSGCSPPRALSEFRSHQHDSHTGCNCHSQSEQPRSEERLAEEINAGLLHLINFLVLNPCGCPDDCDCNLQHLPKHLVADSTKPELPSSVHFTIVAVPNVIELSNACTAQEFPFGFRAATELTALQHCALLCRFTS